MSYTWVEPFAGAAAVALRLVGGRNLLPPVAWMGGKRRYARAIADAMGVPDERPSRVVLCDAGPWGWVWKLLLHPESAARVGAVLRSWAGEHPRELWDQLAAAPPAEEVHERAAQWLWLQARAANSVPCWWSADRGVFVDARGRIATDKGSDRRWAQGQRWEMGSAGGAMPQPIGQNGRGAGEGGFNFPATIADRAEAIADAFLRVLDVEIKHADAFQVPLLAKAFYYLDPPYVGATGYGWDCPRAEVVELARRLTLTQGVVAISEAEPIDLDGWHHLELTRPGGKPEWLTLNRPPARRPVHQQRLFMEAPDAD